MATTIIDRDNGYKALVERIWQFAKPRLEVGILEADGAQPHGDGDVTILDVAMWNEFGTSRIPARSFIRAWFDESEGKLRQDLTQLMKLVVAGKLTKEQALEQIGQSAAGQIQSRIASGIAPENRPSTVARKHSSTPLVDTGALRSSISYRVENT